MSGLSSCTQGAERAAMLQWRERTELAQPVLRLPMGTLCRAEAPRFGRLRLPQLGAGLLRSGADLLLDLWTPRARHSVPSHSNLGT